MLLFVFLFFVCLVVAFSEVIKAIFGAKNISGKYMLIFLGVTILCWFLHLGLLCLLPLCYGMVSYNSSIEKAGNTPIGNGMFSFTIFSIIGACFMLWMADAIISCIGV